MKDELDRKIDEVLSCPGCDRRDAKIKMLRASMEGWKKYAHDCHRDFNKATELIELLHEEVGAYREWAQISATFTKACEPAAKAAKEASDAVDAWLKANPGCA